MNIEQFLEKSQPRVITCRPEDTVQTAATLLSTNRIGAMPVLNDDNKLVGVISERDIVRVLAMRNYNVKTMLVGELMARNIVSCSPEDDMLRAQQLMKQAGVRHLPVVDDGEFIGFISIRDALEIALRNREMEANVMRDISIAARAR